MIIVHKIDAFLFTIFPDVKQGDNELLMKKLQEYYTIGPFKPKVSLENELVTITVDTTAIISQEPDFRKAVALCEKGKYPEAKPILKRLIEKNPTISEYHRIMGQIYSDQGDQKEAINCLIDALRWDSKNSWALLMMGNIFAKHKDDIATAMKYYDQALIAKPNDCITINNIGANLLIQGKFVEAKKYFWEAIKINSKYPNAHFALGLIADKENDMHSAFFSTTQALKFNKNKDEVYQNSAKLTFEIAKKIISSGEGKNIFAKYQKKLELEGGTPIDILEDNEISTPAKIEFAENYNTPKHTVRYKPDYPAVEHLIMHELVHLDFVIQARRNDLNQLFISIPSQKASFMKKLAPTITNLQRKNYTEESITDFCMSLFDGINRQIYNTPIDLFIENFIFNEFPELRPYQFISLYNLIENGITAVTDKKIVELLPKDLLSRSKIYNFVNALQYKDLYGVEFIIDFQLTPHELNQAQEFYKDFLKHKDEKKPAEEYDLVLNWAKALKLDSNFQLVNEKEFRSNTLNKELLFASDKINSYETNFSEPNEASEMEKFQNTQASIEKNMVVVNFMVEALQYFEKMNVAEIKSIAFQIAMVGINGYKPEKSDYKIPLMPNKLFSGYQILAYYYVSWMRAIPDQVASLQLPFDYEYKIASTKYKSKFK
jgi:Tfp pilus assembly protein PilF